MTMASITRLVSTMMLLLASVATARHSLESTWSFKRSLSVAQECSIRCETCDGFGDYNCMSCKGGGQLDSSPPSSCSCSSTQYFNTTTAQCTNCGPQPGCLSSGTECVVDTSSTTCSSCSNGYFLDGDVCRACSSEMPGCSSCTSGIYCTECGIGYYEGPPPTRRRDLLSPEPPTVSCLQCDPACATCDGPDLADCLSCRDGYYKDSTTDLCSQCHESCATCSRGGFYVLSQQVVSTCTQCAPGTFPYKEVTPGSFICASCTAAATGCDVCSINSATNQLVCDSNNAQDCSGGAVFDDDDSDPDTCGICEENCLECDSNGFCSTCSPGYFEADYSISKGATCMQCSDGHSCLDDSFICSLPGALEILDHRYSYCNQCQDGSFPSFESGFFGTTEIYQSCVSCDEAIPGCTSCINDLTIGIFNPRCDAGLDTQGCGVGRLAINLNANTGSGIYARGSYCVACSLLLQPEKSMGCSSCELIGAGLNGGVECTACLPTYAPYYGESGDDPLTCVPCYIPQDSCSVNSPTYQCTGEFDADSEAIISCETCSEAGHYPSMMGVCLPCQSQVDNSGNYTCAVEVMPAACSATNSSVVACETCAEGYISDDDGICVEDPCSFRDFDGECTNCIIGDGCADPSRTCPGLDSVPITGVDNRVAICDACPQGSYPLVGFQADPKYSQQCYTCSDVITGCTACTFDVPFAGISLSRCTAGSDTGCEEGSLRFPITGAATYQRGDYCVKCDIVPATFGCVSCHFDVEENMPVCESCRPEFAPYYGESGDAPLTCVPCTASQDGCSSDSSTFKCTGEFDADDKPLIACDNCTAADHYPSMMGVCLPCQSQVDNSGNYTCAVEVMPAACSATNSSVVACETCAEGYISDDDGICVEDPCSFRDFDGECTNCIIGDGCADPSRTCPGLDSVPITGVDNRVAICDACPQGSYPLVGFQADPKYSQQCYTCSDVITGCTACTFDVPIAGLSLPRCTAGSDTGCEEGSLRFPITGAAYQRGDYCVKCDIVPDMFGCTSCHVDLEENMPVCESCRPEFAPYYGESGDAPLTCVPCYTPQDSCSVNSPTYQCTGEFDADDKPLIACDNCTAADHYPSMMGVCLPCQSQVDNSGNYTCAVEVMPAACSATNSSVVACETCAEGYISDDDGICVEDPCSFRDFDGECTNCIIGDGCADPSRTCPGLDSVPITGVDNRVAICDACPQGSYPLVGFQADPKYSQQCYTCSDVITGCTACTFDVPFAGISLSRCTAGSDTGCEEGSLRFPITGAATYQRGDYCVKCDIVPATFGCVSCHFDVEENMPVCESCRPEFAPYYGESGDAPLTCVPCTASQDGCSSDSSTFKCTGEFDADDKPLIACDNCTAADHYPSMMGVCLPCQSQVDNSGNYTCAVEVMPAACSATNSSVVACETCAEGYISDDDGICVEDPCSFRDFDGECTNCIIGDGCADPSRTCPGLDSVPITGVDNRVAICDACPQGSYPLVGFQADPKYSQQCYTCSDVITGCTACTFDVPIAGLSLPRCTAGSDTGCEEGSLRFPITGAAYQRGDYCVKCDIVPDMFGCTSCHVDLEENMPVCESCRPEFAPYYGESGDAPLTCVPCYTPQDSCSVNSPTYQCTGEFDADDKPLIACDNCTAADHYPSMMGVCLPCQSQVDNSGNYTCAVEVMPAACSATNSSVVACETCAEGYTMNAGGICLACNTTQTGCTTPVPSCVSNTSYYTCSSCNNTLGYYLEDTNGTCISCSTAQNGCLDSIPNVTCLGDTEYTTCSSCNNTAGYYESNGECLACLASPTGCSVQGTACLGNTNTTTCSTCNASAGYYLPDNSNECLNCNTTQIGCSSPGTACRNSTSSEYTCISCNSGYYQSSGVCRTCSSAMAGCSTCSSASQCSTCLSGFYSSPAPAPAPPPSRRRSLLAPVTAVICTACTAQVDGSNNPICTTEVSPTACVTGQTIKKCSVCVANYAADANGVCQLIVPSPPPPSCSSSPPNCISSNPSSCTANGYYTCTVCASGYALLADGTCGKCPSRCSGCTNTAGTYTCLACNPNGWYDNVNTVAVDCLSCSTAFSFSGCTSCSYALNNTLYCNSCELKTYDNNIGVTYTAKNGTVMDLAVCSPCATSAFDGTTNSTSPCKAWTYSPGAIYFSSACGNKVNVETMYKSQEQSDTGCFKCTTSIKNCNKVECYPTGVPSTGSLLSYCSQCSSGFCPITNGTSCAKKSTTVRC